jgi:transcriptional regulator with XRE-family HTH domain
MLLGERIRTLRRRRGLTVQALASSCGLSKGFISQVENGRTSPSLSTLTELAKVLGVSPAFLVSEPCSGAFVTRGNGEHELGVASELRTAKATLLSDRPHRGLDLFMVELPPGSTMDGAPLDHPGEQAAHILSGRARVRYGDEDLDVQPGDTAHWEVGPGVTIANLGADSVRMILASFPASGEAETNGEG